MHARITSVYDEGALEKTNFIGAKGFSIMMETDGQKILFDTGRRGRYLLHNMMFLDVKPDQIDKVVISHGHASHTGGIEDLLSNREDPLRIYAPSSSMGARGMFGPKGVCIPEDLSKRAEIYEIKDWMEIADNLFVSHPLDIGKGQTESFLVVLSKKGPVVIAACSHAGVDSIMEAVKKKFGSYPRMYIGGVHIGKRERQKAEQIAASFSDKGCNNLYLNHCTGVNGIMYMRTVLGLKGINDFYVGSSLELDV